MGRLLHAERYKLFHDKIFLITLVIVVAVNMIIVSGNATFGMSGSKVLPEIMRKEIFTILISCIYGGLFIGSDFTDRTLYHGLMTGKSRIAVLFTKAGIYFLATDAILFIFPLLLAIFCTARNGWGTLLPANGFHMIGIVVALLVLGFAVGAFSLLAAVCFRDVGRTIGIPILLYFVMILLLNSSYSAALARILPVGIMVLLVNNTVSSAYGILLGIIWTVALFLVSALIFRRAELR
ncbi:MAG TPA: hypothetical protein VHO71_02365 [Caproiciproducens sp.]|nr:hypothetical protein [Caproiciproducens sp.]